jgi:hypothetical protein
MTIRIPKPNLADKFLRLIGKKRAVYFPDSSMKLAEFSQIVGTKENFFKALFRPTNNQMPDGTMDVFLVEDLKD